MDNLDNEVIHKAGSVSFQSGSNTLNYSYTPNENTKSTSTIAYEYCFGSTMDTTMAVNLKNIDTTNVTVRYAYSPTKLTSSDTFTSDEEYTIQKLTSRGSKVYIYLLVTPTDEKIPTTFTTSIVFCYGKLQVMTYTANGETKTKEIVKGQSIELFEDPTAPEGYYFDAWFKDSEYKYLANEMDITQASKPLYARFANLPSDWLALDTSKDEYYIVTGTSALPTNLVIPNVYNSKYVTQIPDQSYNTGVFLSQTFVSVDLPVTLKKIGYYAFRECSNLKSIFIPKNVSYVEGRAFEWCNLDTIVVDKNNKVYDSRNNCNAIIGTYDNILYVGSNSTIIPNGVVEIDISAFMNRDSIPTIKIPNTVKRIDAYAFYECDNLISITIPDTVLSVIGYCFSECSRLQEVILPSNLTQIEIETFYKCTALKNINLPKNLQTIGENAFYGCTSLQSVNLQDCTSLTTIGRYAFSSCDLQIVDLPSSLVTINPGVFEDNFSMKSIDFTKCVNLETIGYSALMEIYGLVSVDLSNCTKLQTIQSNLFLGCHSLTDIKLPSSITQIYAAFGNCSSLNNLVIPSSVTRIYKGSFNGCTSLNNLIFEDTSTWYVTPSNEYAAGNQIDVTNTGTNATNIVTTYAEYYWYKK